MADNKNNKKQDTQVIDDVKKQLEQEKNLQETNENNSHKDVIDDVKETLNNLDKKEDTKVKDTPMEETIKNFNLTQEEFNRLMAGFQKQQEEQKKATFVKDEYLQGAIRFYEDNPVVKIGDHKEKRTIVNGLEKVVESIDIEFYNLETQKKEKVTLPIDAFIELPVRSIKFKETFEIDQLPFQPAETMEKEVTDDEKAVIEYNDEGEKILLYKKVVINKKIVTDDFGDKPLEISETAIN